jgi:uncharacterized protein YaaW (UPF0174 family)
MDGFNAHEWEKATTAGRIEHCRMAAREAETFAEMASNELRPFYKELAVSWKVLAAEIQQAMNMVAKNG